MKRTNTKRALTKATKLVGLGELAKKLGVTRQAIYNWQDKNAMPDTEYSGKTTHSLKIQRLTDGQVKVSDLLWFTPPHQEG